MILITYRFIKKYLTSLRKIKDNKVTAAILSTLLGLSIYFLVYKLVNYFLIKWNMGMIYSGDSIYNSINSLSSNRLNVYSSELSRWMHHLIFGNGLAYDLGTARSHNWMIDLLVQSGLLGFSLYIMALIIWYKKIRLYKYSNRLIEASFFAIVTILIQGLAEVSVFTMIIDIILWYFIGLSISESRSIIYSKKAKQIID